MIGSEQERRLENERLFREANEKIASRIGELGFEPELIPFLCECHDTGCYEIVQLTVDDYLWVRELEQRFLLKAGHEAKEDAETKVVRSFDGAVAVEKPL